MGNSGWSSTKSSLHWVQLFAAISSGESPHIYRGAKRSKYKKHCLWTDRRVCHRLYWALCSSILQPESSELTTCQLSYAVYQHKTYRLLTLFRGSLITLIFGKTLKIDATVTEDAEAITLMSADIDRIGSSMTLIHELYGAVIDTALAIWLLYRLIGLALVAPIVWIIRMTFIPP